MYKLQHERNSTDILFPESPQLAALSVLEVGHSTPPAGYTSLKNERSVYVIHYIREGKGSFRDIPVEAPCGFLMTPEESQYYNVDPDESAPQWEQYWIMFKGDLAGEVLTNAGFNLDSHVFKITAIDSVWEIFNEIFSKGEAVEQNDSYLLVSALFDLLSYHSADSAATVNNPEVALYSPYVRSALAYIKDFYSLNLCENDIAKSVHISTKYLYKLFKEEVGMTPMKYLNSYRIKCARKLLKNTNFPISQIAASVGFSDPNYFCRVFQRFNDGVSPLQYRKNISRPPVSSGGSSKKEE
ncbi:MAG: helix-turn-helix domain-containing protein [Clostridia bacterium]|nr:helix-turn-helix domain-containing protein [Clostridia bacterium]